MAKEIHSNHSQLHSKQYSLIAVAREGGGCGSVGMPNGPARPARARVSKPKQKAWKPKRSACNAAPSPSPASGARSTNPRPPMSCFWDAGRTTPACDRRAAVEGDVGFSQRAGSSILRLRQRWSGKGWWLKQLHRICSWDGLARTRGRLIRMRPANRSSVNGTHRVVALSNVDK